MQLLYSFARRMASAVAYAGVLMLSTHGHAESSVTLEVGGGLVHIQAHPTSAESPESDVGQPRAARQEPFGDYRFFSDSPLLEAVTARPPYSAAPLCGNGPLPTDGGGNDVPARELVIADPQGDSAGHQQPSLPLAQQPSLHGAQIEQTGTQLALAQPVPTRGAGRASVTTTSVSCRSTGLYSDPSYFKSNPDACSPERYDMLCIKNWEFRTRGSAAAPEGARLVAAVQFHIGTMNEGTCTCDAWTDCQRGPGQPASTDWSCTQSEISVPAWVSPASNPGIAAGAAVFYQGDYAARDMLEQTRRCTD